jgi:hypothetical protein
MKTCHATFCATIILLIAAAAVLSHRARDVGPQPHADSAKELDAFHELFAQLSKFGQRSYSAKLELTAGPMMSHRRVPVDPVEAASEHPPIASKCG